VFALRQQICICNNLYTYNKPINNIYKVAKNAFIKYVYLELEYSFVFSGIQHSGLSEVMYDSLCVKDSNRK
jgi:hypothetical protein